MASEESIEASSLELEENNVVKKKKTIKMCLLLLNIYKKKNVRRAYSLGAGGEQCIDKTVEMGLLLQNI